MGIGGRGTHTVQRRLEVVAILPPFLGGDSRYSLTSGDVHTLPRGRRLGVISINPRQVMIAFVGGDPTWTGGVALSPGDSIERGGLTLTLVAVGHNLLGRSTAEFEVVQTADPGAGEHRSH